MAQAIQDISWEAEEYIVRDRNVWWYIGLFLVGAGLSAIAVWQGWWTFLVVVILCVIAILTSNLRPPRKIKYTLNKDGLTEAGKLHSYEDFKAFGILKEGEAGGKLCLGKSGEILKTLRVFQHLIAGASAAIAIADGHQCGIADILLVKLLINLR